MKTRARALGVAVATLGAASFGLAPVERERPAPPQRPSACVEVRAGEPLGTRVEAARPGEALCLAPGRHQGPVRVPEGVTVWGPRDAVIHGGGAGTTVWLSSGARLLGVTVDGSGARYDTLDAAVHLTGDDVTVEGVKVVDALFGILSEQAKRPRISGNEVLGRAGVPLGLRGDGIRLWETTGATVEDNWVERTRDCVVWYSSGNAFRRNTVKGGRYGTHFMYSHRNRVEDNRYLGDEVGVFVMYSRDVTLVRNQLIDSAGAAGIGLGLKESGNVVAEHNLFLHDTLGLYLDGSPLQNDEHNRFVSNLFELSQTAVVFHSSPARNAFLGNGFRDNRAQVMVEGGGDALGITWEGNDFDDYQGYDLDGDGVGDLPYELHDLSDDLVAHHPALAFFEGGPVLSLVSIAGHVVPLLEPKPLMVDQTPRVHRRSELARVLEVPLAR